MENYAQLRGALAPASPPKPSPPKPSPPDGDAQLRGALAPESPPHPQPPRADAGAPGDLGERERGILAFERQWWRHAGAKEEAIWRSFGVGPTVYYQLLTRLLDDPAAMAYDPMLVKRLQRQRASRGRRRSTGWLSSQASGGS